LPESSQPEETTVESRPAPPDPILPLLLAAPMSNATPLSRHKASTMPFYIPKCIKKLHLPCQHIKLFLININSKTDRQSSKLNKIVLPALFQIWTNLCGLGPTFEWACTTARNWYHLLCGEGCPRWALTQQSRVGMEFLQLLHEKCKHFIMHGVVQEITYGHVPSNDLGTRLDEDPIKSYETMFLAPYINRSIDGQTGQLD